LREKEALSEEPEAADIGNFIHGLLEESFRPFLGKKPVIDASFERRFFGLFDERFEETFRRKMRSDAFLVKEVASFRLQQFLENERSRPVAELLALEKTYKGEVPLSAGGVRFKSRVDRIDLLPDDSLLILDYKTGGLEGVGARVERLNDEALSRGLIKEVLTSVQLPLYTFFVAREHPGRPVNAGLYSLRNPRKNGIKMFFEPREEESSRARRLRACMKAVAFLVDEILRPDIDFAADQGDPNYCQYCPFFYLCR
jgi:ATP-dependent exoDNAse (exonuclease V) beta subunit